MPARDVAPAIFRRHLAWIEQLVLRTDSRSAIISGMSASVAWRTRPAIALTLC
jgi:hypothetical protein